MGELAMELDFFTDGRLVLAKCQGDSGIGRTVGNTSKDDTAFLKDETRKRIRMFHKKYQLFRQRSDKNSERLKSTSRNLKWK